MGTRALVLGGGGPVGIAWESGLIAGLARAGVDLARADFIMGTSAGSFVGARLALGEDPKTLVDPLLAERETPAKPEVTSEATAPAASPAPNLSVLMTKMAEAASGVRPAQEVRAEIGAFALAAATPDEETFIQSFGRAFANLPDNAWPERAYACSAVDTADGRFQLWTKDSGVGLTRAVASSCSVPGVYPPITLAGARYMDGGMRSSTNADLATGHELVVVIQVRTGAAAGAMAQAYAARFEAELETLRQGGAKVVVLSPDEVSQGAMGVNLMDFRKRSAAARAGLAQGEAQAAELAGAWI
jgi:NTE family protein